ncbi:MAG TPA: DNA topoisomerase I, partial [Coriobacteriia bacterium]|nr:DNA topoisomerase I [Coriobacteriia bacterium]
MKLVVSEKNIAAKKLAEILAVGKAKSDKVYNTPVYHFRRDGEDWVSIGLKGHILGVDFPLQLTYDGSWTAVWEEGSPTKVDIPKTLGTPPWPKKKPFTADGLDLKSWKLASLPYLVWAPVGKVPAEREIIRALKKLAKEADEVVIATDFDREGELIGSDARSMVLSANKSVPIKRARFSAITKEELERAFAELAPVDDCLAQAGESRQDIDLVWGAVLTRYLTMAKFAGYGNVRSAGRVQTPTLALIVEREREREAFVPETYWQVKAGFACCGADAAEFSAGHATDRFKVEEEARRVMAAVEGATSGTVREVERKKRVAQPPTPFNTTELQAAAAREGLSPARAMRVAETLYMNGFISYPRVDNTVYPKSLDLRGLLGTLTQVAAYRDYAQRLLSAGELKATRGKKETTDHPPIHPTGAADPDKMKPEEFKLYNLVARRFMATLSGPATIEGTKVTVDVNNEPFIARGDVLLQRGFREIYPYGLKRDEELPSLAEGDAVDFLGAELFEKQTEPTSRFSAGTLIQEMEKRGLGTKATRHAIIERLIDVSYVEELEKGKALAPTNRGRAVIDVLTEFAPRITSPSMTAELEAEMDDIANGRSVKTEVVGHSREILGKIMDELIPQTEAVGEKLKAAGVEDARVGVCPKSGHDLLVKSSPKTRGQFVGCSGWPDCDVTYPLPQGKIEAVDEACPVCGTPQVRIIQFRQKPLVRCLDPLCETNHEPQIDVGACPTCKEQGREGGRLLTQRSKNLKRFVRCTNYDECGQSYPLPQRGDINPTDEVCEGCGAPMVVITTSKGPWKICIDPNCPTKADDAKKKPARGRTGARSKSSR